MDIRFANATETAEWDARILANPDGGNIFQSDEFAEQKKLGGWSSRYLMVGNVAVTVIEKPVFSLGKLWYIPKGPGVASVVQLGDMLPSLREFASQNGVFAVKVEPELEKTEDAIKALHELGLTPTAAIQPNFSTVLIDLTPDIDTVLNNLNQTSRHAIRRAERDGVTVRKVDATAENCQIFYNMLQSTASANSFAIRSYNYYLRFWRRFADARMGQMFFAYYEDTVIACAFALSYGEKSTYKDGASVRDKSVYGTSHLLQWHVIKWAKSMGSEVHDLCGTPPSDRIDDTTHPHYGVGRFKTSFNKHVTDYVGAYDLIVKPRQYSWWLKYGERLAKHWWWRKHHENWY